MNVRVLPSARLQGAHANLQAFISKARDIAAFGEIDFDEPIWPVKLIKRLRVSSANIGAQNLYFTESKPGSRGPEGRKHLQQPFANFLKALVRLQEDAGGKHHPNHSALIRAGRYLHAEMEGIAYDPCLLLPDHFSKAAAASRKVDSPATAYSVGKDLVVIVGWINRHNLSRIRIDFKNPNPRPIDSERRIGAEADARRKKKLPSDEALNALARLSNLVTDDADVLQMRVIELLVCGGWRINELLTIPENCEVEEVATVNGEPLLGGDGMPVVRYGIRYYGEKGAPPLPKWIPSPLIDLAKRAIADIRRITQPSRNAILFMLNNPGMVPIPGLDGYAPDEMVSASRLEKALGLRKGSGGGAQWCIDWGAPVYRNRVLEVRIGDIATAFASKWPVVPDDSPLALHEHMLLIPANMTHAARSSIPGSVRFLTDGMIVRFLGGHKTKSVFERFGMLDSQGNPIKMNSHQFRDWLNTLALEGGMSDLELARWAGRKDVAQNAYYDHVSGKALAKRIRTLIESGNIRGPLARVHDRLPPQDRQRFREAQIATGHATDIGLCAHDWSLVPCMHHEACADGLCGEHIIVKGDAKHRDEAERLLDDTEFLLSKAQVESADGTYGAGRWVESHQRMARGLKTILAIHNDPEIPDGTLVQPERPSVPEDDSEE
ncbi:hypothetical protein [Microvirga tunisiensis]|uniref:Integrase n=1 Tax=Microvirga tunisiensis TaxID=2108360 RepID=A0A5N7MSF3_9HYPH|nr:hypothetical protein [Microvirga tunisiensis]MPR11368.1 hypothetical protein [Microvirga tunisiensis]MPR29409.1 hypothetical protein [Microvirga tunisiensis]